MSQTTVSVPGFDLVYEPFLFLHRFTQHRQFHLATLDASSPHRPLNCHYLVLKSCFNKWPERWNSWCLTVPAALRTSLFSGRSDDGTLPGEQPPAELHRPRYIRLVHLCHQLPSPHFAAPASSLPPPVQRGYDDAKILASSRAAAFPSAYGLFLAFFQLQSR